jgi:gluconate 2-dehydrogenase gamma chain
MTTFISRRDILKRAGAAGVVALVPTALPASVEAMVGASAQRLAARPRRPLMHLTASEAEILDAVVGRIIPTDETGPGALDAGATDYIDRALGGILASSRASYTAGLAALDQYARRAQGKAFIELSAADQDAVLVAVEAGSAPGFAGSSGAFFNMVRTHTLQGTFCDPYYGGNANFVGWDLVGYPGVRTIVTPDEQRIGADVPANHKSAYDYEMFTKATASAGDSKPHHGEQHHGD